MRIKEVSVKAPNKVASPEGDNATKIKVCMHFQNSLVDGLVKL
jgi:hypothetical protein